MDIEEYTEDASADEVFVLPLSFAQERLWFLDQLEPDSAFYNMPAAVRFQGSLDVAALHQSLNNIVERHEALRTTIQMVDGQPMQVIVPALALELPIVDLMTLSELERQARAQALSSEEAKKPFDLACGPLLRARLLRLADDDHILHINLHHIVADGWSIGIFVDELVKLYSAVVEGDAYPLSPLPIQYGDFAHWQREWLQGEVLERQLDYWTERLKELPATLELPTDRPRPAVQTFRGAHHPVTISPAVTQGLRTVSREAGATLFMTLLAALQVLLSRYSGQKDFAIGAPIANRNRAETEGLIGFFVNTLVLRADLSGNPTFQELLARTKESTLGAYAHQDLPFERLVDELRPERSISHTPLFQVMFALQNTPLRQLMLPGLRLTPLELESGTAKFDLTLDLVEEGEEIRGWFEYNTDLFDAATVARLAGCFITLLESIVRAPGARISELPLLDAGEQKKLLIKWNSTETEFAKNKCIQQLFEAQVEKTPAATAVVFEDQALTYAELNERANQLAHHLLTLGVGPDVLVAICVERSIEMVVGLLGILKAGGAYVPLDPGYPTERLEYMLEDAQASVLVTQEGLLNVPPSGDTKVVCLDRDYSLISRRSRDNPVNQTHPEHLAYVIYTSGSTGRPKGVQLHHLGVANLVTAQKEAFNVRNSDRIVQFASFSFDAAVWECVMALFSGAAIYLAKSEQILPGADLAGFLSSNRISIATLPPSGVNVLSERSLSTLRTLIVAGESCSSDLAARWSRSRRFFNAYGPTESTVCATLMRVTDESGSIPPPIGRPISNTQIYILDTELNPVPIGVAGELHIGGVGLARGYLNRPDLTAEKFIPNPFSASAGERLYKTGDLARYLPDGNIEFRGRIDHQVKVRGFRIELGEIEATLLKHEAVCEAAVVVAVREDRPGDKRLVAYVVVATREAELDVAVLRAFLKDRLPDYMVPAAVVVLGALPLSPNGKVNREALPAPEGRSELAEGYVAPRTPSEETLAGIWSEVLGIDRIGIHDNFFELGGHSLLATQVMSRIRDAFGIELPLRELFGAPTIAEFAQLIDAERLNSARPHSAIEPISRAGALPLSFAQERLWFLDRLEPHSAFYNMPVVVRLQGLLNVAALRYSLNVIVERHEALRTTFQSKDGQAVQMIAPTATVELPVVSLESAPELEREAKARNLTAKEAKHPFDLARGPLVRAQLLRLAEDDHLLQLTMHHIVADGWSMGVIVDELTKLYGAFAASQPSPLSPLPIQYADFAHWQRQWLQGEVLEQQLSYWKKQLRGMPTVLDLPTDRPRPATQSFNGAHYPVTISSRLTQTLRALSQEAGASLFMALLAAFDVLLYRYTGRTDFAVGSSIANRQRAETENLIGFFLNTLVLRADLSGDPTFNELLARTKETALGAYAHQDLPFEPLIDALQPKRDMSHSPFFQVMFVLQNTPTRILTLPELAIKSWKIDCEAAKFDLTLDLTEEGEEITGWFEYNTDLFDRATIARLTGHLLTLLEGVTQAPHSCISELPLLTVPERHRLVAEWNATEKAFPNDLCIHELFEVQVEKAPHATALLCDDKALTFGELNARANQFAHHLNARGVGPGVVVGICMPRSVEMMVGLLGILKAGGAFVPLDAAYPKERLAFMLTDTQASVLLTQEALLGAVPFAESEIVCMDSDWGAVSRYGAKNPINRPQPEQLAYVIYTSGSTGQPKGVMVGHRHVRNYAHWFIDAHAVKDEDVFDFSSALSFDLSVTCTIVPLLAGACISVCSEEKKQDPRLYVQHLLRDGVSVVSLTPSYFKQLLLEVGDQPVLSGLRTVLLGGESIVDDDVYAWRALYPHHSVVNEYGPTEATVATLAYFLDDDRRDHNQNKIPIGKPAHNTQVYILGAEQRICPVGVPGELHIGGASVAYGYLNRPDLTAETFIPNPFSDTAGERLYKTGDLVRYLPDGNIEFLGRIDHQVKVRGFRIELGEVEATLARHPSICETVVVAREDVPGDKRLAAYVVGQADPGPNIAELRTFLKSKLPEFMIPSVFVVLDALPVTPNGKVDRKALPTPETARPRSNEKLVIPRDTIEAQLVEIWEELLDVHPIGVTDDFFELGGHSLLAVRMMARLHERFGREIPLSAVFQGATIERLANFLRGDDSLLARSPAVGIQTIGAKPPFFCVHPVSGSVLPYIDLARCLGADQPFFGLESPALFGEEEPLADVEAMAARYVEALHQVQPSGPYYIGGWSFGGFVAFEMAQQLQRRGDHVALLAMIDSGAPQITNTRTEERDLGAAACASIAHYLEHKYGTKLSLTYDVLQALEPEEQMKRFLEKIRATDLEISEVTLRRLHRVCLANFHASLKYQPHVYSGQITYFRATDGLSENVWGLAPDWERSVFAWSDLSTEAMQRIDVPGTHETMFHEPHVRVLAERLNNRLNEVYAAGSRGKE